MIIYNYLDIQNKPKLLEDLMKTELNICGRHKETLLSYFEKSHRSSLPQYLFLFELADCIGYFFLIGEKNINNDFPWIAVTNADSLGADAEGMLYAAAVRKCEDLNEFALADRLKEDEKRLYETNT